MEGITFHTFKNSHYLFVKDTFVASGQCQHIVSITESRSSDHTHEETTSVWAGRRWGPCRGSWCRCRPQRCHQQSRCAQRKSCQLTDCCGLCPACTWRRQTGGSATAPLQRRGSPDVASEAGRVGARRDDPRQATSTCAVEPTLLARWLHIYADRSSNPFSKLFPIMHFVHLFLLY